jgi:GT2 family glycosyltransferase
MKDETDKIKRVFIAIPTRTGQVYFELMMRLLNWSHKSDHRIAIHFEPFTQPIDVCRNKIVKYFHNLPYDYLMMIDDDIVPPVEALDQMVDAMKSRNIVAAACPLIQPNFDKKCLEKKWNGYKLKKKGSGFVSYEGKKLERVDAVGFGCVMLSKGATKLYHPIFRTQKDSNGMVEYGEDMYFCVNAGAKGYKIYMDYRLKCKHIKACNLLEI